MSIRNSKSPYSLRSAKPSASINIKKKVASEDESDSVSDSGSEFEESDTRENEQASESDHNPIATSSKALSLKDIPSDEDEYDSDIFIKSNTKRSTPESDSSQLFEKITYKKKIKKVASSSSELSEVSQEETVVVKPKRKPKPTGPKYDIYQGHPELLTVWDDLRKSGNNPTNILAPQPEDVLIKLLPFQLAGLAWLQRQEETRFNGGILADQMGLCCC